MEEKTLLKARIAALEKENRALLQERNQMYLDNLLGALLFGSGSFDLSRPDFQQLCSIRFNGDCFFVVTFREKRRSDRLLSFDAAGNRIGAIPEPSYSSKEALIAAALSRHILLPANILGELYCIINFQPAAGKKTVHQREAENELERAMLRINREMSHKYGFPFLISVSSMHHGQAGITEGVRDCALIDEYRRFLEVPEQEVLLYSWFQGLHMGTHGSSISSGQLSFTRCVNNRDYEAARDILNRELLPALNTSTLGAPTMTLHLNRFTDFFISTVFNECALSVPACQAYVEALLHPRSLSALSDVMNAILDRLAQDNSLAIRPRTNLAGRLRKFIMQNYADANTDVNSAAEHFHVSPSHASKVYKQHWGCNMSHDLQNFRVEAAKKLLSEDFSIKEIAESVGFGSSSNFIRTFRKFTGVTPGQFRASEPKKATPSSAALRPPEL